MEIRSAPRKCAESGSGIDRSSRAAADLDIEGHDGALKR